MSTFWKIIYNEDDFKNSSCTCPQNQKEYICKHVVGLAYKKKVLTDELSITYIQSNPKQVSFSTRGRGRPPKVGPSLSFD